MATLKLIVTAGANSWESSKTLSNTDAQRVLAAYQALYATPPTPEVPNPPALTNQQVVDEIATGLFRGIAANVKAYEREIAAKAAESAVTEVTLT